MDNNHTANKLVDMRYKFSKFGKRNKVLFIIVTCLRDEGNAGNIQDLPYGILSIAKYNQDIADIQILDIIVSPNNIGESINIVVEKLKSFSPDIAGISIMFDNAYFSINKISSVIKNFNRNIFIIIGGPAVSPIANQVLINQPNIDAVCFSEAEIPMRDLLQAKDIQALLDSHPSWVSRNTLTKKAEKTLLDNLDEVIDIDYGYINVLNYDRRVSYNPLDDRYIENLRAFPLVTSRGCPFKCAFCWHSGEDDRSMRYASIDKIISHVEKLVNIYGANCIIIYDDMLLLRQERAKEIFKKLANFNLRIELPNGLSPTYMDEELIDLMYKAGVKSIRLAIESGDEWVIRTLVNKPMRIKHVDEVVQIIKKYNIWIVGFFVIGMPGETDYHRKVTREKIIEWGIDQASISIASPIKGSLLYEQCIEEGFIENKENEISESGFLFGENIINTDSFTAEQISREAYLMNLDVNFINSSRLRSGDFVSSEKFFLFVINTYSKHGIAYYCLARVQKLMGNEEGAKYNFKLAKLIYENNDDWKLYFNYFNINFDEDLNEENLILNSNAV